ncbi:unnamed protein product, partial [marine sediment metagenome]
LANLLSSQYGFTRPFLLLLLEEPSGKVKKFIEFALSKKGQDILKSDGLISVTEIGKY